MAMYLEITWVENLMLSGLSEERLEVIQVESVGIIKKSSNVVYVKDIMSREFWCLSKDLDSAEKLFKGLKKAFLNKSNKDIIGEISGLLFLYKSNFNFKDLTDSGLDKFKAENNVLTYTTKDIKVIE